MQWTTATGCPSSHGYGGGATRIGAPRRKRLGWLRCWSGSQLQRAIGEDGLSGWWLAMKASSGGGHGGRL